MMKKLSKQEFVELAERREELKAKIRAMREFMEEDDLRAVSQNRSNRIYKKARLVV